MLTRYTTKTGGVYEIRDGEDGFEARRVTGGAHYTGILSDGAWHPIHGTIDMGVGSSLQIVHGRLGTEAITTSPILKIELEEKA